MDVNAAEGWIRAIAASVGEQADELTRLDAAIGDADHGTNLRRGFTAVLEMLDDLEPKAVGEVFSAIGRTLISKVGGASGPLYGSAFRAIGAALPEPSADDQQLLAALQAGLAAITRLGKASPGDKTIVDAYAPAVAAFERERSWSAAADAAEEGARATISLQARKGRASYLGERSIGHQDPGATSTALIFRALATTLQPPRKSPS
ncbi:dihydroxyacetone kinase subunit DhaL [Fodinicola acaciae]|uniref:dihydroxyacetone kinase subunit DhaL n=1 Tax=Fodinicola acaciae TaxID=2681555 RepID=UPI0013D524AB|nr:dihydroxyacetone kinase subunit DhaL [Fodinicola acaciae]